MRILIPDIWVTRTYIHDLTASLRSLGHDVRVDSEAFWTGPQHEELLLWLWPEGFFRHSLGGRLRLMSEHLAQDFDAKLNEWRSKVKVVGILHNFMPRHIKGTAGRHWIGLYQNLVRKSEGVIHLGDMSVAQWQARFALQDPVPKILKVSHGANEQLKNYQQKNDIIRVLPKGIPRIFVPGDLRTQNEVDMILNCRKKCASIEAQWVLAGGDSFAQRRHRNFWRFKKLNQQKTFYCYQRRLNDFELTAELLAADVVVTPRMRGLNSGIPFLAATFGKPVLMPAVGNLVGQRDEVAGVLFDPGSDGKSLAAGLARVLQGSAHDTHDAALPLWSTIAQEMESFFKEICGVC